MPHRHFCLSEPRCSYLSDGAVRMAISPGQHPLPAASPLHLPKHSHAPRSSKKLFLSFLNNVKMPREGLNQRPLQGPGWGGKGETRDGGVQVPEAFGPCLGLGVGEEGPPLCRGAPGPKEFSSVPRKAALQGGVRGFLPHLAPRGSGGSGEPSGGLGGGGPGPPVWHMVGEGEAPVSGASPEAASVVVAAAPSSTEDSTLNPSSGGAGGSGLRGVSSPRGLRMEGEEREMELLGRKAHGFWLADRSENQALTMGRAPPDLLCPFSVLMYSRLRLTLLQPQWSASLLFLQAQSYPRAFALAAPTAWHALSPSHRTQVSVAMPPLQGSSPGHSQSSSHPPNPPRSFYLTAL